MVTISPDQANRVRRNLVINDRLFAGEGFSPGAGAFFHRQQGLAHGEREERSRAESHREHQSPGYPVDGGVEKDQRAEDESGDPTHGQNAVGRRLDIHDEQDEREHDEQNPRPVHGQHAHRVQPHHQERKIGVLPMACQQLHSQATRPEDRPRQRGRSTARHRPPRYRRR